MNDIFAIYIAAALSAAIFASYRIYFPAIKILEQKAKESPNAAAKVSNLLRMKYVGLTFFIIISFIIFPVMIWPILHEKTCQAFTDGFVRGALQ